MKLTTRLTLVLTFAFTVVYGYSQDIHYDYARGTNFAAYKTYRWVDVPGPSTKTDAPNGIPKIDLPRGVPSTNLGGGIADDELIGEDIKRAVDKQLAQKGLTKVDKDADLQLTYRAAVREEKNVNLSGSGWGPGRGWGGPGAGWWDSSVQGQTSSYPVGMLVIYVYDPARKQLIWRGDATKTVDINKNPDKNYKNLQKAMAKLFKNYPPAK